MVTRSIRAAAAAVLVIGASSVFAQEEKAVNYKDYEVHDRSRPLPPKVDPGTPSTQEKVGTAPSDAVVLFDGKDLSAWQSVKGGEAKWNVRDGVLEVAKGTGAIQTKESFGDCQLHVEWQSPTDAQGKDQGRSNSGVFFMGMYEVQVLDTFENRTYPDGMAGGMYGQVPPLVNPARPAGEWNAYDIIFHKPVYKDGKVEKPATLTILFNGVLVQDYTASLGPTKHKALASYPDKHPESGPIQLQDHGDPVKFRNIWVRALPSAEERPQPAVKPAGAGYERK
jgi:hypothetical protein